VFRDKAYRLAELLGELLEGRRATGKMASSTESSPGTGTFSRELGAVEDLIVHEPENGY
jgi:hypothetical protein